jgi:hypothetical protein
VDLEVLHEVVTPTKVLSTGGDDTFVRFFVCVNRPDVSLEMFPPEETLSASEDAPLISLDTFLASLAHSNRSRCRFHSLLGVEWVNGFAYSPRLPA